MCAVWQGILSRWRSHWHLGGSHTSCVYAVGIHHCSVRNRESTYGQFRDLGASTCGWLTHTWWLHESREYEWKEGGRNQELSFCSIENNGLGFALAAAVHCLEFLPGFMAKSQLNRGGLLQQAFSSDSSPTLRLPLWTTTPGARLWSLVSENELV